MSETKELQKQSATYTTRRKRMITAKTKRQMSKNGIAKTQSIKKQESRMNAKCSEDLITHA